MNFNANYKFLLVLGEDYPVQILGRYFFYHLKFRLKNLNLRHQQNSYGIQKDFDRD